MRAVVTGANGQLGQALAAYVPDGVTVVALNRAKLDLAHADAETVARTIANAAPDIVINAAAYTAVDKAEDEEAIATRVNGMAVGYLAAAAKRCSARFIHISSDFVFDGKRSSPYPVDAVPTPLGAYGRSKLDGERAAGTEALVVRSGWIYSRFGSGNFVRTMLRLMAERSEVRVVADQIGTPTHAPGLATALWRLSESTHRGIFNYSDSGVASWYDFAVAIQEEALTLGMLTRAVPVLPTTSAAFAARAPRPSFSVLDKSATDTALGGPAPHWRENLRVMLKDVRAHG